MCSVLEVTRKEMAGEEAGLSNRALLRRHLMGKNRALSVSLDSEKPLDC